MSLDDIFTSLEAKVVASPSTTKRKTVKGQRSAAKAAAKVAASKQHTCHTPEFDELEHTCGACAAWDSKQVTDRASTWNPPLNFGAWVKKQHGIGYLKTEGAARKGGFVELADEYKDYVNDVFAEPATQHLIDRIVRREIARQRWGKHDLGLLGYSPEDIVSMALWRAYVNALVDAIVVAHDLDWDKDTIDQAKSTLRDYRMADDLSVAAKLGEMHRFIFDEKRGRLRRQDQTSAVRKARTGLELRDQLAAFIAASDVSNVLPTAGAVYREVPKVFREGFKAFNNVLNGMTTEGLHSDALMLEAIQVGDLVDSAEDVVMHRITLDEVKLDRERMLDELLAKPELSSAEAQAIGFVAALSQGYSAWELESKLGTARFNAAQRDALALFAA
jgi:hypothetical protein